MRRQMMKRQDATTPVGRGQIFLGQKPPEMGLAWASSVPEKSDLFGVLAFSRSIQGEPALADWLCLGFAALAEVLQPHRLVVAGEIDDAQRLPGGAVVRQERHLADDAGLKGVEPVDLRR